MSNLLKSKFLLGVMTVAIMFVGAVALNATPAAADCTITTTLRVGSRGVEVQCLQTVVGATADGKFGPMTKASVMAWQAGHGLVADGVFGPKSRAVFAASGSSASFAPAGCTSASGFSPVTGGACYAVSSGGPFPAGCSSASGFSSTTGLACSAVTPQTGAVAVGLALNNPASGTLVAGQATADLAHFTFTGSGTVTGVTLQRLGVSADSTLSNVYLFDGATRLTDAATVSSLGKVTFSAPSGLFTVNGSKTISVKSDILTGTSGQTVGVMLATFTTSAGAVTVNLSGNVHTIASATLAAVTAGTVTPSGATLSPGPAVTVWQSTLNVSNRDVWLKRLALRNVGSAPAQSFANFKLFVNGVQVGTATGLDVNGYVTFDLSAAPVLLQSGSRVVRVDVDVVSGASRTVQFSLRNAADVDFVDSSFGVNIAPTSAPWTPTLASTISGASGGTLTIVKDISSPSSAVVVGGNDVNLGTFKATAYGEPIKLETLIGAYTYVDGSPANAVASLRNGRVLISTDGTNFVQYGSTANLLAAGTSYTLNYTVLPGAPVWIQLHADIFDADGTGVVDAADSLTAKLNVGTANAQRVDSLGSFAVPASVVSANTLQIDTATILLSKNASYANQNTPLPAVNTKIGSFNLAGSSVEDVLLTTLSVDITPGTNFTAADLSNMYAVVKNSSGVIVAQTAPIGTVVAADNNFSINYTLVKNANATVELFADIADNGLPAAISAADFIVTVLQVSGTSMVSGTTVTGGDGSSTVAGQQIAFNAATLTVSKDASSPVAAIAYDNQLLTTLAAKFDAVTAGYNVTGLTITLGANANTVVQSVQLYDGATLVASGPMADATTAVFSGLSWNVPANTSKVLTVKLQLGTVGVGAGTTGSVITTSIAVTADHFIATNTSTGVSTTASTEETGSATGNAMYAYASIPTVNYTALPTSVLSAGTKVLAKFDVVSNGGTVAWKQVMLEIVKSVAPTITAVALYDVTGGANTLITAEEVFQNGNTTSASVCDAGGTGTLCELLISVGTNAGTEEEQVSGTKTYEVRATIAGTLAAANSISTNIASYLGIVTSAAYLSVDNSNAANNATFVWSDISAQSHATTTLDWTDENLVRVLPTSTWTMTYPN